MHLSKAFHLQTLVGLKEKALILYSLYFLTKIQNCQNTLIGCIKSLVSEHTNGTKNEEAANLVSD